MTTLSSFTRSLDPITDFDDDGLSDSIEVDDSSDGQLVRSGRSSTVNIQSLISSAAIDQMCHSVSPDAQSADQLFRFIMRELRKYTGLNNIQLEYPYLSNSSIRLQLRNSFTTLIQSGLIAVGQGLPVPNVQQQSLVRYQQPTTMRLIRQPTISIFESVNLNSKLSTEFEDITLLADGEGAYGKVYVAKKKYDGVKYAIKKIKIRSAKDADEMHREVESLSRLTHTNVVRYYDSWQGIEFGSHDSDSEDDFDDSSGPSRHATNRAEHPQLFMQYLYIQMELCKETLKSWLFRRNNGIDYDASCRIAKQMLKGVAYIHSKRWFHRDLKPQNIFLVSDKSANLPVVKIGDFGLARKTVGSTSDGRRPCIQETFTGKVGTRMYGAPEQLNGSSYNQKSDMFSMGLMFYELYNLFQTEQEIMRAFEEIRKEVIDKEFQKSRPFEADIIQRLTSINPDDRPSAEETLQKLSLGGETCCKSACAIHDIHLTNYDLPELRQQLLQKDGLIAEKDRQLSEKDKQILQLTSRIAQLEAMFGNPT